MNKSYSSYTTRSVLLLMVGVVVTLLSLPLMSAASYTFRQNDVIDYRFKCISLDTQDYCATSTILLINIDYATNGTNLIDNISMTANPTYFNVSLPTDFLGDYKVLIISPSAVNTTTEFSYEVTRTGYNIDSSSRSESLNRGVYFMLGIGVIFLLGFIFLKTSVPIKWTFFIISVIFFLIALNIIGISIADETVNSRLVSFFDSFTAISFIFLWGAGGLLVVIWMLTFFNTWILNKNLQAIRGIE